MHTPTSRDYSTHTISLDRESRQVVEQVQAGTEMNFSQAVRTALKEYKRLRAMVVKPTGSRSAV